MGGGLSSSGRSATSCCTPVGSLPAPTVRSGVGSLPSPTPLASSPTSTRVSAWSPSTGPVVTPVSGLGSAGFSARSGAFARVRSKDESSQRMHHDTFPMGPRRSRRRAPSVPVAGHGRRAAGGALQPRLRPTAAGTASRPPAQGRRHDRLRRRRQLGRPRCLAGRHRRAGPGRQRGRRRCRDGCGPRRHGALQRRHRRWWLPRLLRRSRPEGLARSTAARRRRRPSRRTTFTQPRRLAHGLQHRRELGTVDRRPRHTRPVGQGACATTARCRSTRR